ncbi:MAG: preprotein translocase subunit YajC [Deltaproteobacteria bacterium]|nr:preprotein translocase subunit YajC [Deltaproteobacteria bacterium]
MASCTQLSLGNPLIMMGLMFVIFYFLLIRPQQKKQKEHQAMLASVRKGDEIVTQSGIYGRIAGLTDTIVTLEIADKVRVKMARGQIAAKTQSAPPSPTAN